MVQAVSLLEEDLEEEEVAVEVIVIILQHLLLHGAVPLAQTVEVILSSKVVGRARVIVILLEHQNVHIWI
jgi:hypothetical protein